MSPDRWSGRTLHRATGAGLPCLLVLVLAPLLLPLALLAAAVRGQPLGHRRHDLRHAAGTWHPERDTTPPEQQGGGLRPPLRDNREETR